MEKIKPLYGKKLSQEWAEWVEKSDPDGTREAEIFPFVEKWLTENNPKIILDIGCGQGIISKLIPGNSHYIGVDSSKNLIKRAKKLYDQENKAFKVGNLYSLPIEDKSVDSAISIWVWSHLDNLNKAAKETARVLKPNGKYLIISANPETYDLRKTFYKKYIEKDSVLIGDFDLGDGKVLTDSTLYLHSLENIKNALINAGLTISHESRMGQDIESPKGLYVVFSGTKL
jgi:ubiquinone/menaquinone biosynthesis C-methylase UbiE